jgi:hypothetical protein
LSNINFIVKNDIELKGNLIFEGATKDSYETTLAITDPTADRLITFPNASGTVSLTSHNHTVDGLSNVVITGTPTDGQALVWDTSTSKWVNETVASGDAFPTQSGNTGKFLQTDGTDVSWQDVDLSSKQNYSVVLDTLGSSYISLGEGSGFLKYTRGFLGSSPTWSLDTTTYLTSYTETSTLEDVTDRGATSTNAITISNTTQSTTPTSGALIISGGVGIAKDLWIDGDLHVNGTTATLFSRSLSTRDNLIYLNESSPTEITNAVGDGTYVTYTADNDYLPGESIRITGIDPAGYNISSGDLKTIYSATDTEFVVEKTTTGTYVSGGDAYAKSAVNPDLGFAGGYNDGTYAHAGLFRDASDGVFKFFKGYTPEPDEAVNIDTTHASFALANIAVGDLEVNNGNLTSSASTVNLFVEGIDKNINIGTSPTPYTNTTGLFEGYLSNINGDLASAGIATFNQDVKVSGPMGNLIAKFGFFDKITVKNALPYSIGGTGLTTIGTAGQVLKVNSAEDALEWGTVSGGGGSSAAAVTSDPPSSPELNQVWQDLDNGRIYVWDGDFWIEVQQNGSLGLLRYLGASATAPTTSIDGSDLQVGEVYFDTVFNVMKVYDGTGWEDAFTAGSLSVSRWIYTATGGETTLSGDDDNDVTLAYTPGIEEVYLNGVKLIRTSDYLATDGEEITLEPLIAGSVVEVISYSGFTVADTYTKAEVDDLIQKQGVRWTKVAGSGTSITTLSGTDDYSNTLAYTPGTEQVFVNGILIVRGVDYTATDGSSVVLTTSLSPGDVVEVMGNSTFSVANTYTKAEVDAKVLNYIVCTSTTRPASPTIGQKIYETDKQAELTWNGSIWTLAKRPGEIIECVSSPCDGSTVNTYNGSLTFQNVTAAQACIANVFNDTTGSVISYTPPPGTTRVRYTFNFAMGWDQDHAISYHKFYIDGVEVTNAKFNRSGRYPEDKYSFEWTIAIGGTTNAATGRQASWTSAKQLKMMSADYGDSNSRFLHSGVYGHMSGSALSQPTLTIEAIA